MTYLLSMTQLKIIINYNMHEQSVQMKGKCCQNFLLNLWAFILGNHHATLNDDAKGLSQSHSYNTCQFPELCIYYHYFPIYIQSNHFKWQHFCNLNKNHWDEQGHWDCLRLSISLLQKKLSPVLPSKYQQPSAYNSFTKKPSYCLPKSEKAFAVQRNSRKFESLFWNKTEEMVFDEVY